MIAKCFQIGNRGEWLEHCRKKDGIADGMSEVAVSGSSRAGTEGGQARHE
jgi:hypothetical protein